MIDQIQTPLTVARRLVAGCRRRPGVQLIADFAAGDGALLSAAARYFRQAQLVATDIDERTVNSLKLEHPTWRVDRVDFMESRSCANSSLLNDVRGKVDLLLLNPPFSCRGGTRMETRYSGILVRASIAMSFILQGLEYLSPSGELRAVLPASVLSSIKDAAARAEVRRRADLVQVGEYGRDAFIGCYPRTVLIAIRKRCEETEDEIGEPLSICSPRMKPVEIVRGVIPMHTYRRSPGKVTVPLVHTTDLGTTTLTLDRRVQRASRRVAGPAVLIPRVGQPDSRKIVAYLEPGEIALSDCVFALRCDSKHHAERVRSAIRADWAKFAQLYRGTCAPYLTLGRLARGLERIGIGVKSPSKFSDQYAQSLAHREL